MSVDGGSWHHIEQGSVQFLGWWTGNRECVCSSTVAVQCLSVIKEHTAENMAG